MIGLSVATFFQLAGHYLINSEEQRAGDAFQQSVVQAEFSVKTKNAMQHTAQHTGSVIFTLELHQLFIISSSTIQTYRTQAIILLLIFFFLSCREYLEPKIL